MPFYETTPWLIATVVLLAVWITFAIASAARTFFAPRTRGRYITTTLGWATLYPALAYVIAKGVEAVATTSPLQIFTALLQTLTWVIWRWLLTNADDDHWFKHLRSRLRRRARNFVASLNPVLAPIPVRSR